MDSLTIHRHTLLISAALHFLVDALCCCCMLLTAMSLGSLNLYYVYLTYNVVAFMSQPLTGWLADCIRQRHWLLLVAALLLAAAVLVSAFLEGWRTGSFHTLAVYAVAILLGGGNSFFHVWGGKQVAVSTGNDIRALGVFVATGAFGLSIGALLCSWPLLFAFLLLIPLLGGVYLRVEQPNDGSADAVSSKGRYGTTIVVMAVFAIVALVMFRSFIGEALTTGVNKTRLLILLFGAVSMVGKMAGGWVALRLGIVRALVVVMVAFACCFLWRDTSVAVVLAGLFFINCTMPITLYWANDLLPGREGFAFGLLAAVLVPGFLLAVLSFS